MSVKFNVVAKINPQMKDQPKKYYATAQSSGEADIRKMAKEIAEITTVSLPDVIATLESLVMIIPRHIEQGEIVRLGELGSLRISLSSEGSDAEEEVNAGNIRSAKYIFNPGSELQATLKMLKFSKAKK
jgi:predicted histone-like DNA-binding protein